MSWKSEAGTDNENRVLWWEIPKMNDFFVQVVRLEQRPMTISSTVLLIVNWVVPLGLGLPDLVHDMLSLGNVVAAGLVSVALGIGDVITPGSRGWHIEQFVHLQNFPNLLSRTVLTYPKSTWAISTFIYPSTTSFISSASPWYFCTSLIIPNTFVQLTDALLHSVTPNACFSELV